jgi:hypothetical protein
MASISVEPESDDVRLLLAGACLECAMKIRLCAQFCCEMGRPVA